MLGCGQEIGWLGFIDEKQSMYMNLIGYIVLTSMYETFNWKAKIKKLAEFIKISNFMHQCWVVNN